MTYHLGLPFEYVRLGGFPDRIRFYEMTPQGMEMLYTAAFAFGRHSAAKLVELGFFLATLPLIFRVARRLGLSEVGSLVAATVYFCAPVVGITGASSYNDAAGVFFALGAFYLLLAWRETSDWRYLPAAGALAGFCYAIKFPGVFVVAGAALFSLALRRFRAAAVVAACAAAVMLPWVARDLALTGNPVAPLMNATFPNPYFHVATERELARGLRSLGEVSRVGVPWELAFGDRLTGTFGPLLLALPLGLLAWRRPAGRSVPGGGRASGGAVVLEHWGAVPDAQRGLCRAGAGDGAAAAGRMGGRGRPGGAVLAARHRYMGDALRLPPARVPAARRAAPDAGSGVYRNARAAVRGRETARETHSAERPHSGAGQRGERLSRPGSDSLLAIGGRRPHARCAAPGGDGPAGQPVRVEGAVAGGGCGGGALAAGGQRPGRVAGRRPSQFSGEDQVSNSPQWELWAWPNPWEVPLAFDGNLATRWRTWEPARAGMLIEADFDHPQRLSAVSLLTLGSPGEAPIQVFGQGTDGRWRLLANGPDTALGQPRDLRLDAARALRSAGFRWILAATGSGGNAPIANVLAEQAPQWGVEVAGNAGRFILFHVK